MDPLRGSATTLEDVTDGRRRRAAALRFVALVGLVLALALGLPLNAASSQTEIVDCHGSVSVTPKSGPPGTAVTIKGGAGCADAVDLSFTDAMGTYTSFGGWPTHFTAYVTIPSTAAPGEGTITALYVHCGRGRLCFPIGSASTAFTVTAGSGTVASTLVSAIASPAFSGSLRIRPSSGPSGTLVDVVGRGFQDLGCGPSVTLSFVDETGVEMSLGSFGLAFKTRVAIPDGAPIGAGSIEAKEKIHVPPPFNGCIGPIKIVSATFTVTP